MISIIKATVTTNSEDDEFMRVKVQNEDIWPEESELLSSLNSVYLEVDDIVFVLYETLANPIILGKYNAFEQKYPVEGQVLFSAVYKDDWIIGTIVHNELKIQSSKGYVVDGFFEFLKVTTPDGSLLHYEDNLFKVELSNGTLIKSENNELTVDSTGGKITVKNNQQSLFTILDDLLQALASTTPTTQGSPTAQVFNPSLVTAINNAKTYLGQLMQ